MFAASTSKAFSSNNKSGDDVSRADYLKKYVSSASGCGTDESGRKKSKKKDQAKSGKGMRLLEEDTFLPLPPPDKRSRMPLAFVDTSRNGERWEEEEEDEDELLILNAKKQLLAASRFKSDSFVTIDDQSMESSKEKGSSSVRQVPQKNAMQHDDSDNSPVRHREKSTNKECLERDLSPPRKIKREPTDHFDGDISPQRHSTKRAHKKERSSSRDVSPPRRRANGASTSRVSPSLLSIKKEPEAMSPEKEDISGRNAVTKKRVTLFNKTRKSNRKGEEIEDPERKERELKKQEELNQKYKSWNKGVAQIKEREMKIKEMEEVVQEGFSRYADNEAMNEHLKDQLLEDDPMADYFKTKKHKVQMRSGIVFPEYKGSWPPNRFSISPGYRWDGVDRSNGFEGKMSMVENKRRAQATETYKSIIECED